MNLGFPKVFDQSTEVGSEEKNWENKIFLCAFFGVQICTIWVKKMKFFQKDSTYENSENVSL